MTRTRIIGLLRVLFLAQFALWLIAGFAEAFLTSVSFNGFPADGPFQLFNPLRRIAAGQRGGIDFQFFHGLAIPYASYPIFALAGKTIFASEAARFLLPALLFTVSLVLFALTAGRGYSLGPSVLLALPTALVGDGLFDPGNSMLGARSAVPVMFVAVLMLPLKTWQRIAADAVLLGASLLMGSEHGMALAVGHGLVQFVVALRHRSWRPLAAAAASVLGGIAAMLVFFVIVGGWSGALNALRYAFGDVMLDQFWYFGAPPNYFIHSWQQFLRDPYFLRTVPIAVVLLAALFAVMLRTSDEMLERRAIALAVFLVYLLITCTAYLGIATRSYFQPLERGVLLCVCALAVWALPSIDRFIPERRRSAVRRIVIATAAGIVVVGLVIAAGTFGVATRRFALWKQSGYESRLSTPWRHVREANIAAIGPPRRPPPRIWSTYAGLTEDDYGVFHSTPYDYIIHALGPERRAGYTAAFVGVRPEYAQTLRNSLFQYEEWVRAMHWDFYEELLRSYHMAGATRHSLWWQRGRSAPAVRQSLGGIGRIAEGKRAAIDLAPRRTRYGVVVVTVDYRVHNPWKSVPFFGRLPRHLIAVEGALNRYAVALPPYQTRARIPVFVEGDQQPSIRVLTRSLLPGATTTVESGTIELIDLEHGDEALLTDPSPFFGNHGYVIPPYLDSAGSLYE